MVIPRCHDLSDVTLEIPFGGIDQLYHDRVDSSPNHLKSERYLPFCRLIFAYRQIRLGDFFQDSHQLRGGTIFIVAAIRHWIWIFRKQHRTRDLRHYILSVKHPHPVTGSGDFEIMPALVQYRFARLWIRNDLAPCINRGLCDIETRRGEPL